MSYNGYNLKDIKAGMAEPLRHFTRNHVVSGLNPSRALAVSSFLFSLTVRRKKKKRKKTHQN